MSERSVRNYCAIGKIHGTILAGKTWKIPETAEKPKRKNAKIKNDLLSVLREEKRKHLKHWMYILLLLVSVFMLGFALYLLPQYLQGGYSLYSMDMLLLLACFLLWGIYLVISARALAKRKFNE